MRLVLDTGILGQICHPRRHQDARDWLGEAAAQHEILVSEVADYELRRELLRIESARGLARLDELIRELRYLPVTTATWRLAARLWARQRRAGRATASADSLDGDVLVAAQARSEAAVVITSNIRHFEGFVMAMDWPDVPLA